MKKTLLRTAAPFLLSAVIITGCSKDSSLKNTSTSLQNAENSGTQRFVGSGSVTGLLSPAPVTATVTAIQSGGYSVTAAADAAGRFHIAGLPDGLYTLLVEYISFDAAANADIIRYKKIVGVRVRSNMDTDLGVIGVQ